LKNSNLLQRFTSADWFVANERFFVFFLKFHYTMNDPNAAAALYAAQAAAMLQQQVQSTPIL
jgi:hypothetical protein